VYGSYDVMIAVQAASVCSKYWQTYAWSKGQRADFMHVYQYQNGLTANGIGIDLDEGYGDYGGWSLATAAEPVPEPPAPLFDAVAAQKVIAVLGALHGATDDEQVREAAHRAADVLRADVGIVE